MGEQAPALVRLVHLFTCSLVPAFPSSIVHARCRFGGRGGGGGRAARAVRTKRRRVRPASRERRGPRRFSIGVPSRRAATGVRARALRHRHAPRRGRVRAHLKGIWHLAWFGLAHHRFGDGPLNAKPVVNPSVSLGAGSAEPCQMHLRNLRAHASLPPHRSAGLRLALRPTRQYPDQGGETPPPPLTRNSEATTRRARMIDDRRAQHRSRPTTLSSRLSSRVDREGSTELPSRHNSSCSAQLGQFLFRHRFVIR